VPCARRAAGGHSVAGRRELWGREGGSRGLELAEGRGGKAGWRHAAGAGLRCGLEGEAGRCSRQAERAAGRALAGRQGYLCQAGLACSLASLLPSRATDGACAGRREACAREQHGGAGRRAHQLPPHRLEQHGFAAQRRLAAPLRRCCLGKEVPTKARAVDNHGRTLCCRRRAGGGARAAPRSRTQSFVGAHELLHSILTSILSYYRTGGRQLYF